MYVTVPLYALLMGLPLWAESIENNVFLVEVLRGAVRALQPPRIIVALGQISATGDMLHNGSSALAAGLADMRYLELRPTIMPSVGM
jgi:hypothetical protein